MSTLASHTQRDDSSKVETASHQRHLFYIYLLRNNIFSFNKGVKLLFSCYFNEIFFLRQFEDISCETDVVQNKTFDLVSHHCEQQGIKRYLI